MPAASASPVTAIANLFIKASRTPKATFSPVLFSSGLMEWYEPAFNAVEIFMLGIVQILVIALGMRFFEKRWPLEKTANDKLVGVDRVYTVLNKLGVIPRRSADQSSDMISSR